MTRLPTLCSLTDVERMSDETSSFFISMGILAMQDEQELVPISELPDKIKECLGEQFLKAFPIQVMLKRLQLGSPQQLYSPYVLAFFADLSRNVAENVMWAYTIFEETRVTGEPITFAMLGDLFPTGFPTKDAVHQYWDAQKLKERVPGCFTDNQLDLDETWLVK